MRFRACYCSVFDECWVCDLMTVSPEPVEQCTKSPDTFTYLNPVPPSSDAGVSQGCNGVVLSLPPLSHENSMNKYRLLCLPFAFLCSPFAARPSLRQCW